MFLFRMQPLNTYLDYRQYLRDFYEEQKRRNPRYSHRLFALKAGLTSTGFFSEVLSGKRQLAPAAVLRFCKALKLNAQEQACFEILVAFNQAKTIEERNHLFSRLSAHHTHRLHRGGIGGIVDIVGQERFEFYRRWYHAALRELIAVKPVRGKSRDDFALLGKSLEPPIPAAKARQSVELLLRLGFITRADNGILTQATPLISTGDLNGNMNAETKANTNADKPQGTQRPTTLDVDNFQAAMLELARKALDRQPRSNRDFSTLTLSLSAAGEAAARAEIAALRKRLMALAEQDPGADRVRQFNFQSFPLSKPEAGPSQP